MSTSYFGIFDIYMNQKNKETNFGHFFLSHDPELAKEILKNEKSMSRLVMDEGFNPIIKKTLSIITMPWGDRWIKVSQFFKIFFKIFCFYSCCLIFFYSNGNLHTIIS